ncbi:MAG: hypothetical protein KAX31_00500 [Thermoplasmata archaeon]|nr:hypothetical protein [Thermoplasmata archaeon]
MNLRRIIEFKYEMDQILVDLPENTKGTIKGSIIAKADKIDQNAALDFIESKVKDETISAETGEHLSRLVQRNCKYR